MTTYFDVIRRDASFIGQQFETDDAKAVGLTDAAIFARARRSLLLGTPVRFDQLLKWLFGVFGLSTDFDIDSGCRRIIPVEHFNLTVIR